MNTDRFNVNASLSAQWGSLQQQHAGTGHPDMTKREWAINQHRDSYASYLGHQDLVTYFALAENVSLERARVNMLEKMRGRPTSATLRAYLFETMPIRLRMTDTLRHAIAQTLDKETGRDALYSMSDRALLRDSVAPGSDSISLDALEALERCLRAQPSSPRPSQLRDLLRGSVIDFPRRKSISKEDPDQVRRKAALQRRKEQREYDRMVANVDHKQRADALVRGGAAVSVKRASYGAHIIVGMFLGFGAGYMLSKSVYDGSTTVQFVGGIIGMVGTLMLEVSLYIIREEKVKRIKKKVGRKAPPTI